MSIRIHHDFFPLVVCLALIGLFLSLNESAEATECFQRCYHKGIMKHDVHGELIVDVYFDSTGPSDPYSEECGYTHFEATKFTEACLGAAKLIGETCEIYRFVRTSYFEDFDNDGLNDCDDYELEPLRAE